jgi:hypothetical protein
MHTFASLRELRRTSLFTLSTLKRLAPFLIILFAFAARIYALDTTYVDGDRANPHGMALLMVYQVTRGEFTDLLLFADDASTGIPNGPVANYVWAAVSLFERSLLSATAFGLMANVVAVAVVYALGRRCFDWTTGVVAATLIATSNWGVFLARGMWHPGQVEVSVVVTASLLAMGVQMHKPTYLFWGFIGALLTAGHYFGAMVMPFQAAIATLAAGAWKPPLRRAWLAGLGVGIAGLVIFVLAMALTGRFTADRLAGISLFNREAGVVTEGDLIARDITPFNRDPIAHFLRLASNRDYAVTWTSHESTGYALREPLTQFVSLVISAIMIAGLLRMALQWRKPANAFLLLWAALPIAALLLIAALKRDFRIPVYYLLLTVPTMYIAGGQGVSWLLGKLNTRRQVAVAMAACAALAAVPAWNFAAAAETVYAQKLIDPGFIPLKWAQQLGRQWQRECSTLNGSNYWWDLSLYETPAQWRPNGTRDNDVSSIWSFRPEGGTCALTRRKEPMVNSALLTLPLDDGSVIRTDRALPYAMPQEVTMTVNLGWSLLEYSAPAQAQAGDVISVTHVWRVDALPNEPFAAWYFTPYIKLIAPDGRVVASIDNAVALRGQDWRAGDLQGSAVLLPLPANLPAGEYTIQSSLFDPNQKKNAVYFSAARPSEPILTLERAITVQ